MREGRLITEIILLLQRLPLMHFLVTFSTWPIFSKFNNQETLRKLNSFWVQTQKRIHNPVKLAKTFNAKSRELCSQNAPS